LYAKKSPIEKAVMELPKVDHRTKTTTFMDEVKMNVKDMQTFSIEAFACKSGTSCSRKLPIAITEFLQICQRSG